MSAAVAPVNLPEDRPTTARGAPTSPRSSPPPSPSLRLFFRIPRYFGLILDSTPDSDSYAVEYVSRSMIIVGLEEEFFLFWLRLYLE